MNTKNYARLSVLIAAAMIAAPVWSAGEALEQGFLNPPPQAYPGGSIRIAANLDQVRTQLERQKELGIHHLSVGSEGALGAYMSDAWKNSIALTVAESKAMGFEVSMMTSPGFSHTGDSQVQPEEAMKKIVWTETLVVGGKVFNGRLSFPPSNSGPFQNIAYFNESPWTLAMDKDFYRDIAVIAYRTTANNVTARPAVTSNKGPIDATKLSANDPRNPVVLDSEQGTPWLQLDYPALQNVSSVSLATPETLFEESALIDLLAKQSDGTYKKIATFNMRSAAQVTLSFPVVRSNSFRFVFSRLPLNVEPLIPKGGEEIDMSAIKLPFGPKRPASVFAINAITLFSEERINEFERKAGFFTFVNDYYALATNAQAATTAAKTDVIDLTGRMQADGTLNWQAPAGNWRVLRFGYSLTGKINHPAPPDATGWEVDKLSAKHMSKYLNRYLDGILPMGEARKGMTAVFADSIESGPQNWTDELFTEFQKRRGYDMRPFMPTLTGVIVQSATASDKFLWDFRQTIADLMHENTYAKLAELARARGLKTRVQALEQARHQLGDDFEMRRYADEPMGALWGSADPVINYLQEYPNQIADQRGAASVAHVYGRKVVAAESGTTLAYPGAFSPRVMKQFVDLEFAIGVNWIAHAAPLPRDSWRNYGAEWLRYLARSSYMLQQGRYVADVAYYYGQDAPLVTLRERLNDAPLQHGYDYINTQALLSLVSVKDGKLTTPSGMEYRVLQLGGSSNQMTVSVLRRLRDLVSEGLIVAGAAPTDTPSLADSASEFKSLREQLWGPDAKGRRLGKGKVYGLPSSGRGHLLPEAGGGLSAQRSAAGFSMESISQVLAAENVAADVITQRGKVGDTILFQHRRVSDGEFYFVMNRAEPAGPIEISFRQSGKAPELWRADTGERTPLPYRIENGRTVVSIDLRQNDAMFLVFRNAVKTNSFTKPTVETKKLAELDSWAVNFGDKVASPPQLNVGSWSDHANPAIKYFSGTAIYSRAINVQQSALTGGAKVILNLGEVQDIADVSVNGVVVGVRWTPPYSFDITSALKPGDNSVEIKITNRAVNSMIGAAQTGAGKGFGSYKPNTPLRPAGLIGPVELQLVTPK